MLETKLTHFRKRISPRKEFTYFRNRMEIHHIVKVQVFTELQRVVNLNVLVNALYLSTERKKKKVDKL